MKPPCVLNSFKIEKERESSLKSPLEVNVDKFFIDFQWPYDAQIIPRRFQVARRGLLLDPNLLTPPGRAQRASERSERSERSDHNLYRALRFLSIFSCVSIASVSCTFLDIFRVLLFVILVRASRSDAKTGLSWRASGGNHLGTKKA